jgi:hypothetical protein
MAYIADRFEDGVVETEKVIFSVKSDKKVVPAMLDQLYGVVTRDGAACGFFSAYIMPIILLNTANS